MLLTEFSTWYTSCCQEQCFGCLINLVSNLHRISIPYLFNWCLFSVTDVLLWSGIDKGPPRKEKFPEPQALIKALEAAL